MWGDGDPETTKILSVVSRSSQPSGKADEETEKRRGHPVLRVLLADTRVCLPPECACVWEHLGKNNRPKCEKGGCGPG